MTLVGWLRVNSRLKFEVFGKGGSLLLDELLGVTRVESWKELPGLPRGGHLPGCKTNTEEKERRPLHPSLVPGSSCA